MRHFNKLYICRVFSEEFFQYAIKGEWKGPSAAGSHKVHSPSCCAPLRLLLLLPPPCSWLNPLRPPSVLRAALLCRALSSHRLMCLVVGAHLGVGQRVWGRRCGALHLLCQRVCGGWAGTASLPPFVYGVVVPFEKGSILLRCCVAVTR